QDAFLAGIAYALQSGTATTGQVIARPGEVLVAVVGAHLTGMPLNHQLTSRKARLVTETTTAPDYALYALDGTVPPKPGLARVKDGTGAAIIVEVWAMPEEAFGSFVNEIPEPLGIGTVRLMDSTRVNGFIAEGIALEAATDITQFGGWRAYIASKS
ncbi:MAG: allophanate hydrolase, partial [Ahrensia sp.]